jgi:hypothetical protein
MDMFTARTPWLQAVCAPGRQIMNGSHIQSCGAAQVSWPTSAARRATSAAYWRGLMVQRPCSSSSLKPPESSAHAARARQTSRRADSRPVPAVRMARTLTNSGTSRRASQPGWWVPR